MPTVGLLPIVNQLFVMCDLNEGEVSKVPNELVVWPSLFPIIFGEEEEEEEEATMWAGFPGLLDAGLSHLFSFGKKLHVLFKSSTVANNFH